MGLVEFVLSVFALVAAFRVAVAFEDIAKELRGLKRAIEAIDE